MLRVQERRRAARAMNVPTVVATIARARTLCACASWGERNDLRQV